MSIDFAKLREEAAAKRSGKWPSKKELDAHKEVDRIETEDIIRRYGINNIVKVGRYDDHLAFGRPFFSYPGKVLIVDSHQISMFESDDLKIAKSQMTKIEEEMVVFHYGDKRFVKMITPKYDYQDAIDEFSMGIQRHRWNPSDLAMAGYRPENFPLNKNGDVTGYYNNINSDIDILEWTNALKTTRKNVQDYIKCNEIKGKEIWPPKMEAKGFIFNIVKVNKNYDKDAIIALGFPDGTYQLQKSNKADQLEIGYTLDFKMNNNYDSFDKYIITNDLIKCYMQHNDDGVWQFQRVPHLTMQNYGPFKDLDEAMEIMDKDLLMEYPYEMTEKYEHNVFDINLPCNIGNNPYEKTKSR